ncbi:MAG: hypothetical protein ACOC70_00385 [bacterium]
MGTSGSSRTWAALWATLIAVATVSVYATGLRIRHYGDDFAYIYADTPTGRLFTRANRYSGFYRPLEALFLKTVQRSFGFNTLPAHAIQALTHAALCLLIFCWLRQVGFATVQAGLAGLFMGVWQVNVLMVLSNDTFSQVGGTFFGCLTLFLLYHHGAKRAGAGRGDRRWLGPLTYLLAVAAFVVSLFCKESSVSFFPLALAVLFLSPGLGKRGRFLARERLWKAAPFLVVFVLYMALRASASGAEPEFGESRYDFRIGFNIVRNVAQFGLASALPVSTVRAYAAHTLGSRAVFAAYAAPAVLFLGLVAYGLVRCERNRALILVLAAFAFVCFFPMAMMNHVSEGNVYNAMPFLVALFGIGWGRLWTLSDRAPVRALIALLTVALLASHAVAVRSKAAMMVRNGRRAWALLDRVRPYVDRVPPDGRLYLLNPPPPRGKLQRYSVFILRGFNPLYLGEHVVGDWAGREDIRTKVINADELDQAEQADDALILTLDGDKVRVVKPGTPPETRS